MFRDFHLGKGDNKSRRELSLRLGQKCSKKKIEGSDPALVEFAVEGLDADADEGRQGTVLQSQCRFTGTLHRNEVFLFVRTKTEPVFVIYSKILNRFAFKFLANLVVNPPGQPERKLCG